MSTVEDSERGKNPSPPPKDEAAESQTPKDVKEGKSDAAGAPATAATEKIKETPASKPETFKCVSSSYSKLQFGMSTMVSKQEAKPSEKKVAPAAEAEMPKPAKEVQRRDSETSSVESYNWRKDIQPDRSKSDFYCEICDSHMNSEQMWVSHVSGKRHIKNMNKEPGDPPSKVKTVKRQDCTPQIKKKLDRIDEPLVGLSYVCELQRSDPHVDPTYTCYLCHATCTVSNIIEHLLGTKHRLAYLKEVDQHGYDLIQNMSLKKHSLDAITEEHVFKCESRDGRGVMEVKIEKPKNVLVPPMRKEKRRFDDYENDYLPSQKRPSYRESLSVSGPSSRSDRWTPTRDRWSPSRDRRSPQRERRTPRRELRSPVRDIWSPPREPLPVTLRQPVQLDFNSNDVDLYPMHIKLEILLKLSRPVVVSETEAEIIMKAVSYLTQSLMQYKIRNLPSHLQDRLARHIVTGDTRDLEQVLGIDNSGVNNFEANPPNAMDLFPPLRRSTIGSSSMGPSSMGPSSIGPSAMGPGDSSMRMGGNSISGMGLAGPMNRLGPGRIETAGPMSGMGANVAPPMSGSSWAGGSTRGQGGIPQLSGSTWGPANGPRMNFQTNPSRPSGQNWPRGLGNNDDRSSFGY